MLLKLKDKVAIITGAGSGIGRITAQMFCEEGAKVVVADIDESKVRETAQIITEKGGEATNLRADISKSKDVQNLMDTAIARYGRIDILHNNAGIIIPEKLVNASEEDFDRTLSVNLKGVWLGCKLAIPYMIQKGGGVIVNTASRAGFRGYPEFGVYCASKAGVIALTRVLAIENASHNIRVNCVCPGPVATPMAIGDESKRQMTYKEIEQRCPLGRIAQPHDVAKAVLFLSSDDASFITGEALVVDGGESALL